MNVLWSTKLPRPSPGLGSPLPCNVRFIASVYAGRGAPVAIELLNRPSLPPSRRRPTFVSCWAGSKDDLWAQSDRTRVLSDCYCRWVPGWSGRAVTGVGRQWLRSATGRVGFPSKHPRFCQRRTPSPAEDRNPRGVWRLVILCVGFRGEIKNSDVRCYSKNERGIISQNVVKRKHETP